MSNHIIVHLDEAAEDSFRSDQERRLHVNRGGKLLIALAVLLVLLIAASMVLRLDLSQGLTLAEYLALAGRRLSDLGRFFTGGGAVNAVDYVFYTYLIVALVGAALAACGAMYQGVFRNPMASPTLLGVQSGGMLAATLYVLLCMSEEAVYVVHTQAEYVAIFSDMSTAQRNARQLWVFLGCFLGAALVVGVSRRAGRGKLSTVVLFLMGSVLSSLVNMAVSLVQYYLTLHDATTSRVLAIQSVSMGTFNGAYTLEHLLLTGIPILTGLAVLFLLSPRLNLLMFGEDEARAMGLRVDAFRMAVFAVGVLLSGVVLAFCGQIGFVGLIVPHLSRRLAGSDYRRLSPASALLGAIVMVLVYDAAYFTGFTSSINLITSLAGGVVFLVFLLGYRRRRNADWA